MTLPEIIAKITGVEDQVTALKANASASASESTALRASLAEATAQLAKLKAEADAAPAKEEAPDASGGVSEGVKAIENAITILQGVLKDISGKVGGDEDDKSDDEADAEAGDDADMEAKSGNWNRALALRQRQLKKLTARVARKTAVAKSKEEFDKAVASAAAAQIAALGIKAPLALTKPGEDTASKRVAASIPAGVYGRGVKIAGAAFSEDPAVMALSAALGRSN